MRGGELMRVLFVFYLALVTLALAYAIAVGALAR
jgi:hypothetical protein